MLKVKVKVEFEILFEKHGCCLLQTEAERGHLLSLSVLRSESASLMVRVRFANHCIWLLVTFYTVVPANLKLGDIKCYFKALGKLPYVIANFSMGSLSRLC